MRNRIDCYIPQTMPQEVRQTLDEIEENISVRCLTTMDEMLDRLINSTGVVGR